MQNNIKLLNERYFAMARELALQEAGLARNWLGLPEHFIRSLAALSPEKEMEIIESLSVLVFRLHVPPALIAKLLELGKDAEREDIQKACNWVQSPDCIALPSLRRAARLYCHAAREMASEDVVLARIRIGLFDPLLTILRDMPLDQFWFLAEKLSSLPLTPRLPAPLMAQLFSRPMEMNRAAVTLGAQWHVRAVA